MASGRAWILNLDAELELESPVGYQPSRAVVAALVNKLGPARALLSNDDALLWPLAAGATPEPGMSGACWCPTPSAIRRLTQAGVVAQRWPHLSVLQHVNHRKFQLEVAEPLPGTVFAHSMDAALESMRRPTSFGYLCKRAFSFASRSLRHFSPQRTPAQVLDDERWLRASVLRGGILVEPYVVIEREYALHGMLEESGSFRLGHVCTQVVEPLVGWQRSAVASHEEAPDALRDRLRQAAERCAQQMHQVGYFGPFGIDSFTWRAPEGLRTQTVSDINARYTMGWAIGMGELVLPAA